MDYVRERERERESVCVREREREKRERTERKRRGETVSRRLSPLLASSITSPSGTAPSGLKIYLPTLHIR